MYKITRDAGPVPKVLRQSFASYEAARSACRIWIRKNGQKAFDFNLAANRNPTIRLYGFSIKQA